MAAPSIKAGTGITVVETCDTGGGTPDKPTASFGDSVTTAENITNQFNLGINGTGQYYFGASTAGGVGPIIGAHYALGSAIDLSVSGRLLLVHLARISENVSDLGAADGIFFALVSSSTSSEEALFPIGGGNVAHTDHLPYIVNANRDADANVYDAAFDSSDVTHIGVAAIVDGTAAYTAVDTYAYLDPIVIINGESGDKGQFQDFLDYIDGEDCVLSQSPTTNIHFAFFCPHVGDGSTETHYEDVLNVVEFPKQPDFAGLFARAHINDNDLGHQVNASANCVIAYTRCTWLSDSPFHWRSIGSTSASVTYTSCTIVGAGDVQLVDGHVVEGGLFDSCGVIQASDPTLTNTAIRNATGAALELGDGGGGNCSGLTLASNATAIIVDVAGDCAIDVTGMTFTGNTVDIEYTGTGTLTVTSNVTHSGKTNASGGGTITVNAPETSFTINSSETGSLIQIFETGTQTLLDSATGASLEYVYSGTVVVDYVVQKAGFLPQRFTGVTLTDSSVTVVLENDPVYDSGHGLTYTTDFAYNRTTSRLSLVNRQEGRDFYSALVDAFIAESGLRNTAFKLKAVGPDSIFFIDDAEIDSDDLDNWYGTGIRYVASDGSTTAEWIALRSSGTIPSGATLEYQQVAGSGTTDARATGALNQIIQTYGDSTHGNFDYRGHLVVKAQVNGYRPVRVDVLAAAGVSALEPFEYTIAIEPVAIAASTGDPAITITVTDHAGTPETWNGKDFSITVLDSGTNSGEDILRELNYNLSLDTTYQGKDPFNWPEMVLEAGSAYETLRGVTEGGTGATLKGVRVLRGSDPHPDFVRFQADDGTYYTPPTVAGVSAPNLTAGWLELYNVTTDTLIESVATTSGYSATWTDGTDATEGDTLRLRWRGVGKEPIQMLGVATADSIVTFLDEPEEDTVYTAYGIDGSTVTEFAFDSGNVQFDIDDSDGIFYAARLYAWFSYAMVSAAGIANFWGAASAENASVLVIDASVGGLLDNVNSTTIRQGDAIVIKRSDGSFPVVNPTSGGGGISLYWAGVGYTVETGVSGLTSEESTRLMATSTHSEEDVVTALQTAVATTPLPVDVKKMNGAAVLGTGASDDLWRGE